MAANMKLCRKQTRLSKAEWREWEKCREMGWGGSMMLLQSSSHRPDWATIQEAPSRKWKGNNPPPLLQIIRQWTWLKQWSGTMDRGKEQEKSGWRVCLIFSSPLSLRATGPSKRRKPECSVFPSILHVQAALWGYQLMRWKKKKKNPDEKQIKKLTGMLSWAETLIEKQNKMMLSARHRASFSWDIISASSLNIIITTVIIIRPIHL